MKYDQDNDDRFFDELDRGAAIVMSFLVLFGIGLLIALT